MLLAQPYTPGVDLPSYLVSEKHDGVRALWHASTVRRLKPTGRQERTMPNAIAQADIDPRVYDLYDEYCHGRIDCREYLTRASALAALGIAALAMAASLLPQYAKAQMVPFIDARIKASDASYPHTRRLP